ncbi:MAG TPA: hypothetical protein VGL42_02280 [Opitutaceae bacterium]
MSRFVCACAAALAASTCASLTAATINGSTPYLNGANIPWNAFGTDFGGGSYSATWWNTAFANLHSGGVNAARIWLHCDGRATPTFNSNGDVTGISSTLVPNLQNMLTEAANNGIHVYLSLWSFDLFNNNHASLVTNTQYTTDYINNALIPICKGLKGYSALAAIEIINEPEWGISQTPNTTTQSCTLAQMQAFIKSLTSAIHSNLSGVNVTVGSASVKWDTANGKDGTVGDWYANLGLNHRDVHYYSWMVGSGYNYNPLASGHTPAYYGWTVPAVVGEFAAMSTTPYTSPLQMMSSANNNGFAGHMPWSYGGVDNNGDFADFEGAAETFNSTPTYVPTLRYDFEGSTISWAVESGSAALSSSTSEHYTGSDSLKVSFTSNSGSNIVGVAPSSSPAGRFITFWLWVPSQSALNGVEAYCEYGSSWTWTSGAWLSNASLAQGAWNEINLIAPAGQTIDQIGLLIEFSSSYTGSFYVDSVTY